MANNGLFLEEIRILFQTRSFTVDFLNTLTEDGLHNITKSHRYLLRSLMEDDVKNLQVHTCGYAIYNGVCMRTSTLRAVSKECVENFITRIPAGISSLTVTVIPVNWFTHAGSRLLTVVLSLDSSYLQHFNTNVIEFIGANHDDICKKIAAGSLVNLSNDQKKLFKAVCLAEIENIDQTLFYQQEDNSNRYNGNVHNDTFQDLVFHQVEIHERNLDNSAVTIKDVQSSAISFKEHSNVLTVDVPIVKRKRGRRRKDRSKLCVEKNEVKENKKMDSDFPFKEGDIVIQPLGKLGKGPFYIVKITEGNNLVMSDCKNGRYKRTGIPKLMRIWLEHEIIPCPVFKVNDKVAVQRENGNLIGPLIITAIDSIKNAYLLTETGSGNDPEFFEVPWNLLTHYDVDKSNEYVKEKLEGEDIVVHPKINTEEIISFTKQGKKGSLH